ncbi:MAG: hypothetical protein L0323_09545 [Planctomycetes bacterium]|nr:hypothetical protein [Planctomycetota bacterium]
MRTSRLLFSAAALLLAPAVSARRIWTITGLPGVLEENATTGELLSAYPLPPPFVPFLAPLSPVAAAIPLAVFGLDPGDLLVGPPFMTIVPATAVGPGPGFGGTITVPAMPVDPAMTGATVFAHWVNFDGILFGFSRGLSITVGAV